MIIVALWGFSILVYKLVRKLGCDEVLGALRDFKRECLNDNSPSWEIRVGSTSRCYSCI